MPNWWDEYDSAPATTAPVAGGNWWDSYDNAEVVDEGGPASLTRKARDLGEGRGLAAISPIAGLASMAMTQFGGEKPLSTSDLITGNRTRDPAQNPVLDAYRNIAPDSVRRKATGFMTGVPSGFSFGWDDELAGLAGQDAKEQVRALKSQARQDTPVSMIAGEIVGGIASPVNKVMAPLKAKTISKAAWEGAKVGAKGGALYGAGEADGDLGDRATGAVKGAVVGAVLGAPLGAGGKLLGNKLSTGEFLPDPSKVILQTIGQEAGVGARGVQLFDTLLRRSGLSAEDISASLARVDDRVQLALQRGETPPVLSRALQEDLQAVGKTEAANNISAVYQHLQNSGKSQISDPLNRAVDDSLQGQEGYLNQILDDVLGPAALDDAQAGIAGRMKELGKAKDEALSGIRQNGNPEVKQVREMLNDSMFDPEFKVQIGHAARRLNFRGENAVRDAIEQEPFRVADLMQSALGTKAAKGDVSAIWPREQIKGILDRASRYNRNAQGRFQRVADDVASPFTENQAQFRANYKADEALEAARGFVQKSEDAWNTTALEKTLANSSPEANAAFNTGLKVEIQRMLNRGKVDEIVPWITQLRRKGFHEFLKKRLGEEGEKISRVLNDMADTNQWAKKTDARTWGNQAIKASKNDADVKNLFTKNPVARLANKYSWRNAAIVDFASNPFIPGVTPVATATKAIGTALRPGTKAQTELAKILASKAMTNVRAGPVATGAPQVRPVTGAAVAAPAVQTAPRQPVTRPAALPAPQPAPEISVLGQRAVYDAQQRVQAARQRIVNAQARGEDETVIRQMLLEQTQAENAARLAEQQAANAARVTQDAKRRIVQQARNAKRELKRTGRETRRIEAERLAAEHDATLAAGELDTAMKTHTSTLKAADNKAEALEMRTKAKQLRVEGQKRANTKMAVTRAKQAAAAARTGVDPADIYDETGILALKFGAGDDVVFLETKDYAKTMAKLQRDILKVKYSDQHTRETKLLEDAFGWNAVRKAAEEGSVSGWTTPAQRQTRLRTKQAAGVAGAGLAGTAAYGKYDDRKQAVRAKAFEAMEKDRNVTKLVQKALKAAGHYKGRNDGRFDTELSNALITFQRSEGISKPGTLNMKTTKALQDALIAEGRTEEAAALKAASPK